MFIFNEIVAQTTECPTTAIATVLFLQYAEIKFFKYNVELAVHKEEEKNREQCH